MTKYIEKERARYWPISPELMSQYRDGSHDRKSVDGTFYWYKNSLIHRDRDLPAVINANGGAVWFQGSLWHRDGDLPAYIGGDGTVMWYQTGQRHRINGPAVIRSNMLEWWIRGQDITLEVLTWLRRKRWQGTPEQIAEFQLRFT